MSFDFFRERVERQAAACHGILAGRRIVVAGCVETIRQQMFHGQKANDNKHQERKEFSSNSSTPDAAIDLVRSTSKCETVFPEHGAKLFLIDASETCRLARQIDRKSKPALIGDGRLESPRACCVGLGDAEPAILRPDVLPVTPWRNQLPCPFDNVGWSRHNERATGLTVPEPAVLIGEIRKDPVEQHEGGQRCRKLIPNWSIGIAPFVREGCGDNDHAAVTKH